MKVKGIALALTLAAVLAGVAMVMLGPPDQKQGAHQLRPDDANVVAAGAKIYEMHCASCHGAKLEGQPDWRSRDLNGMLPAPPHDASGHTWHHDDETLFQLTKQGIVAVIGDSTYKTAMPVYADVLSDAQIIAVLSWIKAQWPPEVRRDHDLVNAPKR